MARPRRHNLARPWMLVCSAPTVELAIIPHWTRKRAMLTLEQRTRLANLIVTAWYVDWLVLHRASEAIGVRLDWWWEPFAEPEKVPLFVAPKCESHE